MGENPHRFIYDGHCGLCVAFKNWLMEYAPPAAFEALSFDDPRVHEILTGKSEAEICETAHVVTPEGRILSGHAAIRIALSVRWRSRMISNILALPFLDPVLRFIYTRISLHRYRLSCKADLMKDAKKDSK
ncbi:MAG: hypothetical protein A3G34_14420 [Candidatus Lindowbacteria bacterium RIFCSPLOWO2_12_FULL_62_27]|nr:MAG: hypothetical protein A3I06_16895 [Candidatus Lindowbacteria bacterium RIFCSPLOWO2_02_FULL_62_12]OGH62755.1 MAG: hypothetical protein A3G34_14420 [Candidatus Lindowbacteria bacterium RIFCSPLOWO2_12_FULL_62_27]